MAMTIHLFNSEAKAKPLLEHSLANTSSGIVAEHHLLLQDNGSRRGKHVPLILFILTQGPKSNPADIAGKRCFLRESVEMDLGVELVVRARGVI
jgi:hypothetical protein